MNDIKDMISGIGVAAITMLFIILCIITPIKNYLDLENIKEDNKYLVKAVSEAQEEIKDEEDEIVELKISGEYLNAKFEEISNMYSSLQEEVNVKKIKEETAEYSIPNLDTSFKGWMDYRFITDTTSDQWQLQQVAFTDEYGLRVIEDCYCVAMGTYYAETCGSKFRITTDTENVFNVTVADIKNPLHTDETNRYLPMTNGNANVLEFIIDTDVVDNGVIQAGDVSYYSWLSGNITKIEKIG